MKFKGLEFKEKIVNILLNILIFIFSIVLIISVYNAVQLKIFKNDYSNFFGYSVFEVQTNSMSDYINSGDWIIVKITDNVKLKDVITFKKDNEFITHRVIEKYSGTYITKGDANESKDEPIDQKQIVGKVVKILPNFGILRRTLFNKAVLLALIVTLFFISVLFKDDKKLKPATPDSIDDDIEDDKLIGENAEDNVLAIRKQREESERDEENIDKEESYKEDDEENLYNEENENADEEDISYERIEMQPEDEEEYDDEDSEFVKKLDEEYQRQKEAYNNDKEEHQEKELKQDVYDENSGEELTQDIYADDDDDIDEEQKVKKEDNYYDEDESLYYQKIEDEEENIQYEKMEPEKEEVEEETSDADDIIVVTDIEREIEELHKQVKQEEEEILNVENTVYNEKSESIRIDASRMEEEQAQILENRKLLRAEEAAEEARIAEEKKRQAEELAEQKRLEEEKLALENDKLTQITLEKLREKRKNKKFKNVIEKIMYVKYEELNEFIDLLNDNEKLLVNEPSIKNELLKAYIDAKFYNEGEIPNSSHMENIERIKKYIANYGKELITNYQARDKDYGQKVVKYLNMLKLIINLECTDYSGMTDEQIREHYYKEIITFGKEKEWKDEKINKLVSSIKRIQRKYINVIELLLKNLETDIFSLEIIPLKFNKRVFALELKHNIKFNKIYSEVVIDETYSKGIIAEDKMTILINLLLMQLIKDMILTTFNKKYILYLPDSIYKKKNKFDSVLKMLDDKYVKENTIILIKYDLLMQYKDLITKKRKDGYNFAILINEPIKNKEGFKGNIYLGEYIFVNPKKVNAEEIKKIFPDDYMKRLVVDEINEIITDLKEGDK